MILCQEGALDRSIDRKVRILLRLRKELTNPTVAAPGHSDDGRMESIEGILESDMLSHTPQSVEALEDSKMKERCGNVAEEAVVRMW